MARIRISYVLYILVVYLLFGKNFSLVGDVILPVAAATTSSEDQRDGRGESEHALHQNSAQAHTLCLLFFMKIVIHLKTNKR